MNILIFICSLFCSCGLDKHNDDKIISMIHSQGLTGENLGFNDMLFFNAKVGFIVGASDEVRHNPNEASDTFAFVKSKAFLYKTIDGGKTWTAKSFGEGSLSSIVNIDKRIFLTKISDENLHSTVYVSNDLGETWNENFTFPSVITDILVFGSHFCIVAKDHDGIFRMFEKKDNSWVVIQLPLPIYSICNRDGVLYYLSTKDSQFYKKNLLVSYDFEKKISNIFELPKGFDAYFLSRDGEDIRFVGVKDGYIESLLLSNGKYINTHYSYEKESGLFPQGYYVSGGQEWIIVGGRESFGVSNKILKTNDSGKNWQVVEFQNDKLVKPFYFLKENGKAKAWFYSGSGDFQILE